MGLREVDADPLGMIMQIKSLDEIDRADKKQLTDHPVVAFLSTDLIRFHPDHLGNFAAEQNAGQGNTGQHSKRQVVRRREHGDGKRHQHHGGVALWNPTHIAQAIDIGSTHRDADHHGDQSSHWNLLQPGACQEDHGQQTDAREQCRKAGSAAVVDVHHRLTNQGAASHTAKKRRHDVGDALTAGFNIFVGG